MSKETVLIIERLMQSEPVQAIEILREVMDSKVCQQLELTKVSVAKTLFEQEEEVISEEPIEETLEYKKNGPLVTVHNKDNEMLGHMCTEDAQGLFGDVTPLNVAIENLQKTGQHHFREWSGDLVSLRWSKHNDDYEGAPSGYHVAIRENVSPELGTALDEKYIGFAKLKGKLAKKGVRDPGAVAASIGRKKYGRKTFEKAAHEGKKLKGK